MLHHQYWNLSSPPFENLPDPVFYFPSGRHEHARHRLIYGVQAMKGLVLVTGEIGCGKTLLSRTLINDLPRSRYDVALVVNPALPAQDFLIEVSYQLGLDTNGSKVALIHRLNERLLANHERHLDTILVVDEAQTIQDDSIFEDLRLLLNFQLNNRFLLTLVLLGQPELLSRIKAIPQLSQRVAVRYHLAPLTGDETYHYIQHRLKAAGGYEGLFTEDAATEIFQLTGGVSRLINALCDTCLLLGAEEEQPLIDLPLVRRACHAM